MYESMSKNVSTRTIIPQTTFDCSAFWQALDRVRQERGVRWYTVFQRTGVNAVTRAATRGNRLLPENIERLAAWAGIDAADYRKAVQA